jgi:hypothetical protein
MLSLLLAAATVPDVPEPEPVQWVCDGTASGTRGAEVSVTIQFQLGGELLDRSVLWQPPRIPGSPDVARPFGDPDLSFFYGTATIRAMGKVTSVLGSAVSVTGARRLKDATLLVAIDGRAEWSATLPRTGIGPDSYKPSFAVRSVWLAEQNELTQGHVDLLAAIESGHIAVVSLESRRGKPLGYTQYDLAQTQERTRLLAEAWQKAEDKRQHLDQCTKAVEPTRKMKKRVIEINAPLPTQHHLRRRTARYALPALQPALPC